MVFNASETFVLHFWGVGVLYPHLRSDSNNVATSGSDAVVNALFSVQAGVGTEGVSVN